MAGYLIGVGVGPGDPELMTLKACRLIRECDIVAIPNESIEKCVAYEIAKGAVPELVEKEILCVPMPMTKDRDILKKSHEEAAQNICRELDQNKKVVFLTLGDPTIYSTYIYIHKKIEALGYGTEIVSGIPSFCAVAARLNIGLTEGKEQLHVIPASYDIDAALKLPGTKVFMKAGSAMKLVKKRIAEEKCRFYMVENCGMKNEKIYNKIDQVEDKTSYYSLIILKEK